MLLDGPHSAGIYVLNNTKQPLNVNELIKAINGITLVNRINLNVLSGPLNPSVDKCMANALA